MWTGLMRFGIMAEGAGGQGRGRKALGFGFSQALNSDLSIEKVI